MSTRRLLMTLLSTGVSVLALSQSPAVAAQKPFEPVTPWTVNRIDPANGSASYCTLARRFTGNTVITFARNAGGEGTIAVDFQQPLFSTDQTYRIGLQAGGGMKREFMTRPATPNALVLRSGEDPEFFNALANSTELGVIMDERRYAFSVPDFNAGDRQMANCLGGTSVPSDTTPSASVALPDDDRLAGMRAELDALRAENAGIVASLKEQTAEVRAPQQSAESNQLMQRLSQLEQEKNALVEKLQSGQEQEMQDVSALKSALEDQKAMKSMLEAERAQRQQLEQALTTQTAEAEKRGEMKARIEQLEASNTELKTLRDAVETERAKRIAAETALKAQATASLEEQERVRTRIADLESQNKSLQLSAEELVVTKSKVSQEQARREAAESALKDMQVSISKRDADMLALQMQVESERAKMEAAENAKEAELTQKHADEMARLNAQIDAIKAAQEKEIAEREGLMGKVSAETARREAAEQAVRDMQTSISKREADMVALQTRVDAERKKMEDAANARDQELSRKHADQLSKLNADMEKLRAAQDQALADAKAAREELMGKVATESARREAAEATVRDMQVSISKREADMASLQAQMDAERAKLETAANADKAELAKKHQDEIARMSAELEQAKIAQAQEAEKVRLEVEKTQAEARAEVERIKAEQIAAKKQAETEALAEVERIKAMQMADAQALEEVQTKIATEEARRAAAEKAMAEYQNKVAEERQKLAQAEDAKESETVKQHQDEIARLNKELALIKSAQAEEINKAQSAAATESARREATEKELESTRAQLVDAQERVKKGNAQDSAMIIEMQDKLAQLEKQNSALMADLKTAQASTQSAAEGAVRAASQSSEDTNAKIAQISAQADADKKELQAMLEAEQQRREKVEGMLAKGSDDDSRMKIMGDRLNELQARNKELQQKLEDQKSAAAAAAVNPAAGESEEVEALRKQLAALKKDNEMLAEKLSNVANQPQEANVVNMTPVAGDGAMASDLAETQASLASVMAERDEYKDLLQRERMRPAGDKAAKGEKQADESAVAHIKKLEAERADLIRQLEYERSRIEQIAAGKESAPALADASAAKSDTTNQRVAELEAQMARLEKQLTAAQNDVIDARQQAKFSAAKASASDKEDVAALLAENKKLQMELAAASKGSAGDTKAMETEIATLRAQNKMLNEEINKRLAAAPERAEVDNAVAKADFSAREAREQAQREAAADLNKAKTRVAAADAENIRLARELAQARQDAANVAKAVQGTQPMQVVAQAEMPKSMPMKAAPIVSEAPSDQGMSSTMPPAQMMRATMVQPQVQMQAPQEPMFQQASVAPATEQPVPGPNGRDISSFLQRSGISMVSGFEKINKVSNANFGAFRWDTGVVFGTAEQQRINNERGFKDAVAAYMEKTRNRCSGTFDQSIADGAGNENGFSTADVACIMPDGTGAGAAMVFYYKDGMFNAVAHEGNLDTFEQAMTTRDKLAQTIKGQL